MSKYAIDLDYAIPTIDISPEELNEIIEEADSIIADNSASPEQLAVAYLKKGQCLFKLVQVEKFDKEKQHKAKEFMEKALELKPDMPEALMRLGTIYSYLSEDEENYFDEAITMLTKAIQLKPDYAAAFNNRGCVYSSEKYSHYKNENYQDNLRKAIDDISEAIRIRPFDATYYFNRGRKYSATGEHEKAVEDFSKSITLKPDQTRAFLFRGITYFSTGDKDKAKIDFDEVLRRKRKTR